MRWTRGHRSDDVEDRRGQGSGGGVRGGGGRLRLGLGGIAVLALLSLATGQNFFALLDPALDVGPPASSVPDTPYVPGPGEQELVEFVSFVLDDVQGVWREAYPALAGGAPYEKARLVLFTDAVRSACGAADAEAGPFYCPADRRAYIDLAFYGALRERFGAPGDFAQAYVLAHEIGHHVQTLLGVAADVREAQRRDPARAGALQVRMELQADCLAGVWAHATRERGLLEAGDVEEALGAAAAVGDDRLQRAATGRVQPETFTHGSSRQRAAWFMRGLRAGDARECDTFAVRIAEDARPG